MEAGTASAPDHFTATGRLQSEAARARAEELFLHHGRLVAGLCRGLLRDAHEGEDAAQQAFLSAYRALLRGDDPREPAAWMAAIARNECLSRIRQRMREPLPIEDPDRAATAADPLDEALRRADLTELWRAISELAPQQREALLLREFGGLSYGELGVALGVSVPAVESLLFRARTRLRERLETVAAAFGGAGWISAAQDALARLGSAKLGSLPLAAKAATATLGIAAAAGGAVVVEQHATAPRHRHAAPVQASAALGPPSAAIAPTSASGPPARVDRRRSGGGGNPAKRGPGHDGGGDHRGNGHDGGGDHGGATFGGGVTAHDGRDGGGDGPSHGDGPSAGTTSGGGDGEAATRGGTSGTSGGHDGTSGSHDGTSGSHDGTTTSSGGDGEGGTTTTATSTVGTTTTATSTVGTTTTEGTTTGGDPKLGTTGSDGSSDAADGGH